MFLLLIALPSYVMKEVCPKLQLLRKTTLLTSWITRLWLTFTYLQRKSQLLKSLLPFFVISCTFQRLFVELYVIIRHTAGFGLRKKNYVRTSNTVLWLKYSSPGTEKKHLTFQQMLSFACFVFLYCQGYPHFTYKLVFCNSLNLFQKRLDS